MARKESITINDILNTGFAMAEEEGIRNVTARKVAAKAGCSTQPIFRLYKNMEELWGAVYGKAATYFEEFYKGFAKKSNTPFVDLGMAYISFAMEHKNLFRLLFVEDLGVGKTLYEVLNGTGGNVIGEINKAKSLGCAKPQDMFMRMWIFIHGAACMSLKGDYDLSLEETGKLLEEAYKGFMGSL
ncbi:MAG: TetR/AcrR family transcriptional regulator [Lachnospiraceae bacterium]|nr:TetR/AcrR family transcriptional regulator [Lachnospiraceae bacterium]MBR4993488.1 TetR/AcrR family transcriptional regulator [Lachnospiraceae bacterium]